MKDNWAYLDFKINIYLFRKTMKEEMSKVLSLCLN